MAKLERDTGVTPVEVLVILLVSVLLGAMLPPACRHAKSDALRATCRANLARIGRAMVIYSNDYEGVLPRSGGFVSTWGEVAQWNASNRYRAFGMAADGSGGWASISSCFYLLVKYTGLQPRDFLCPGDTGTTEFRLSDVQSPPDDLELIDAWDFGPESYKHCSYAYHLPFGLHGLTLQSDPGMPVAADRNPWLASPARQPGEVAFFKPDLRMYGGTPEQAKAGNSISHGRDGQNVLFLDTHVSFEERSYCGLENDNIYLVSPMPDRGSPLGTVPVPYSPFRSPTSRKDSLLVHDPALARQAREVASKDLKQTAVVPVLDCPLPEHGNAIWCSTFQMAWDQFKDDVIGAPIQVVGAEELANRLNATRFPSTDIEESSYYVNAGFVKDGIIEQIQKDMAHRFGDEPAPTFEEGYKSLPDVATAYAYLNVNVGFEYPYYSYSGGFNFEDSSGVRTAVTAFCAQLNARGRGSQRLRDQVEILHYSPRDASKDSHAEFAVDLCKDTRPYQVILARVPRSATLDQTARTMHERIARFKEDRNYKALRKLRPSDTVIVPDVLYKLRHHFEELSGKYLGNEGWRDFSILEAMQKIDFALGHTGMRLRSEARTTVRRGGSRPLDEPRRLHFDRPFLICVKKRDPGAAPFFLMWVDNPELMNPYEAPNTVSR